MTVKKIQTGVWLDQSEAFIIRFENGIHGVLTLTSDIEHYNLKGGSRSKVPYGPMDKTSESKKLARHALQEKKFFDNLLKMLSDSEEVYLFGPAYTKYRFHDFLSESSKFEGIVRKSEAADKMSENQRIAKVREFFKISEKE